jgi:hypothetical protein
MDPMEIALFVTTGTFRLSSVQHAQISPLFTKDSLVRGSGNRQFFRAERAGSKHKEGKTQIPNLA